MARYIGPVCRLCRREGAKLMLKGDRCYTEKCAVERRAYAPGQHGQRRGKLSDYGQQLREKQKVKRMYGLLEKQFRKYFEMADRKKGVTGEVLLQFLERRLDNAVYRMGFAANRAEARQLVRHGHFRLNGHKANIPSILVRPGDVVEVIQKSQGITRITEALESVDRRTIPGWLSVDKGDFRAKVNTLPERDDITMAIQEQLIVELYSK
ncbi:MAG: 30S ribosomal protein S4 [Myxococcales bacterium]|nr:30S ribosomal protein S4 [Myxococcales bacterium]